MRLFRRPSTAANPNIETQPHGPATWARQPRMLARTDADAVAYIAATLAACLTAGVCVFVGLVLHRPVSLVLVAAAVMIEAAGIFVLWVWVYADALRSMNRQVKRATWQQEEAQRVDLDGDGVVGTPRTRIITVTHKGQPAAPIVLEDDEAPEMIAGFELSADDLRAFVNDSQAGDLSRSWWKGRKLPSGAEVGRGVYDRVTGEMERQGWIERSNGRPTRWRLDSRELAAELARVTGRAGGQRAGGQ